MDPLHSLESDTDRSGGLLFASRLITPIIVRPTPLRNGRASMSRDQRRAVVVDGDVLRRDKRVDTRAWRVDVSGDPLGTAQPAIVNGLARLLGHKFGGASSDPLDQLVADVEADRIHHAVA